MTLEEFRKLRKEKILATIANYQEKQQLITQAIATNNLAILTMSTLKPFEKPVVIRTQSIDLSSSINATGNAQTVYFSKSIYERIYLRRTNLAFQKRHKKLDEHIAYRQKNLTFLDDESSYIIDNEPYLGLVEVVASAYSLHVPFHQILTVFGKIIHYNGKYLQDNLEKIEKYKDPSIQKIVMAIQAMAPYFDSNGTLIPNGDYQSFAASALSLNIAIASICLIGRYDGTRIKKELFAFNAVLKGAYRHINGDEDPKNVPSLKPKH